MLKSVLTEDAGVRIGLATIATCTTAVALYAILRVTQSRLFVEPDPASVLWSEHSGFFWRVWTATYLGGILGFVTWLASARHAPRVAAFLTWALWISATLLAAQALLVP